MVLFTHNVEKIKYVPHKNGDVDGTCKRSLRRRVNRLADSENVLGASHAHPAGKYRCESTSNVTLYPLICATQRYWDKSATIMSHWGKPCPFIRPIIRTERKIPIFTWVASQIWNITNSHNSGSRNSRGRCTLWHFLFSISYWPSDPIPRRH